MNVFVLGTGRCGSVTFIKACEHITNYTSGHETRLKAVGLGRFDFKPNHIEADNRLAYFLARLEFYYGKDAYYVHLRRNETDVVESYIKKGVTPAGNELCYLMMHGAHRIMVESTEEIDDLRRIFLRDMLQNRKLEIDTYLSRMPNKMVIDLETIEDQFPKFWEWIGAEGDLDGAMGELKVRHNAA